MDDKKKENIARLGIATKGVVYSLIGGITALSVVGVTGQKAGSSGVLDYVAKQPFGRVVLGILALGLICFVLWRCYQAIMDPENHGKDLKGIVNRLAYLSSGAFYAVLAYAAVKRIISGLSSGSGGGGKESMLQFLLDKPLGQILVTIVGCCFLGKAIYQLYKAYSGKYRDEIEHAGLDSKAQKVILNAGKVGYTARGIVIIIVSYLIFKAAWYNNSNQAGGKEEAFQVLQSNFGSLIMALVAIGLLAYGIFMFVKAKYRPINIKNN
ncbi:DUF1206 domain-containing protein [Galbibacter mesophilus]|uniref:DUF1206 domain-containing protein n=1 Tax=Galbibacter mesophilus TaxID=379069 RepID=UPI00191D7C36|nr:DUF1206 domain-containing protein [Galbibacter mesophilus]MCM5663315.1 DUF1206 domain-containing protein [Galbibacter mesophilus]